MRKAPAQMGRGFLPFGLDQLRVQRDFGPRQSLGDGAAGLRARRKLLELGVVNARHGAFGGQLDLA